MIKSIVFRSDTKKEKVKEYAELISDRNFTISYLHQTLTGVIHGIRWHNEILNVSRSTVRRALDELVDSGTWESYYAVGHCFDELRYRKISDK